MSKRFFDDEDTYDTDFDDEKEDVETRPAPVKGKGLGSKFVMGACAIALIGAVAGLGSLGISAMQGASAKRQMQKAVDEYIKSADTGMEERISEAIDAYAKENQPVSLKDLVGEEGEAELMDSILSDLGQMELTDTQKEQLSEALTEIFSEDGSFTISGKAVFSDESKAYLTDLISQELAKTLVEYYGEGSDVEGLMTKYADLEKTVKEIVSTQTGKANITYSLTDSDRDKIKESVISALGNIKGADGKNGSDGKDGLNGKDGVDGKDGKDGDDGKDGENGKDGEDGADGRDGRDGRDGIDGIDGKDGSDGKDGRDGKDGSDGYSPRKGVDYFTESEIDSFVKTIEGNVKTYFDRHELDEIAAMTESIKQDVLEVFTSSADNLEITITDNEKAVDTINDAIGTGESSEGGNSNVYSNTTVYKKGDIIVRDGKIYQCLEDMEKSGAWDPSRWSETDLVTVNNYYNTHISETKEEITKEYTGLVGSLEQKVTELVNKVVSGLTQSIENTNKETSERLGNLENSTNSKLDNMAENADSRMDAIESGTNDRLDSMQSDTDGKLDSLKSDTDQKLGDLQSDTDDKITALGSTVEEKIGNLSDSMNAALDKLNASLLEKIGAVQTDVDKLKENQPDYELTDNGDGTYRLDITNPVDGE
ncbi:MAG: apolipoprotein A1/A4/E family protein [Oribacterium sp.]|nr:apolipoprotein A1/A4/E family protein [Oribacterium sp.]